MTLLTALCRMPWNVTPLRVIPFFGIFLIRRSSSYLTLSIYTKCHKKVSQYNSCSWSTVCHRLLSNEKDILFAPHSANKNKLHLIVCPILVPPPEREGVHSIVVVDDLAEVVVVETFVAVAKLTDMIRILAKPANRGVTKIKSHFEL